jgi:head-tail adaptor
MKDRLRIESPVTVQDATGGTSTTWQTVRTVPARRLTEKGLEAFAGARLLGKVDIAYAVRWWPGSDAVDQLHRFVDLRDNRIFNIVSAVESEHHWELVLMGTAGANRG